MILAYLKYFGYNLRLHKDTDTPVERKFSDHGDDEVVEKQNLLGKIKLNGNIKPSEGKV